MKKFFTAQIQHVTNEAIGAYYDLTHLSLFSNLDNTRRLEIDELIFQGNAYLAKDNLDDTSDVINKILLMYKPELPNDQNRICMPLLHLLSKAISTCRKYQEYASMLKYAKNIIEIGKSSEYLLFEDTKKAAQLIFNSALVEAGFACNRLQEFGEAEKYFLNYSKVPPANPQIGTELAYSRLKQATPKSLALAKEFFEKMAKPKRDGYYWAFHAGLELCRQALGENLSETKRNFNTYLNEFIISLQNSTPKNLESYTDVLIACEVIIKLDNRYFVTAVDEINNSALLNDRQKKQLIQHIDSCGKSLFTDITDSSTDITFKI